MDNHKVKIIKCMSCDSIQAPKQTCSTCDKVMGKYYCNVCRFYCNNEKNDKYHCDKCNFCKAGVKEKTFHCDVCECCMDIEW